MAGRDDGALVKGGGGEDIIKRLAITIGDLSTAHLATLLRIVVMESRARVISMEKMEKAARAQRKTTKRARR